MKDVKALLKEAREAIKSKDYEQSLKLCKQILREERDNYTALVFTGVCFQETGQPQKALGAFKCALEVNPSNPLAWNGLVNHYEKNGDDKAELANAYASLLKIETTEKKLKEYAQKLSLLRDFGDLKIKVEAIRGVVNKCEDPSDLWVSLVDLLKNDLEFAEVLEEALTSLLANQKTVCTEFYAEYLSLLYRQGRFEEVVEGAKKMRSLFEIDAISLRWLCKVFNERFVEEHLMVEGDETMEGFSDDLLRLEPQSPTALFTKAILLYGRGKVVEAKETLSQAVGFLPGLLHAWVLLLRCCMRLGLLPEALQASGKINKLLKSKKRLRGEVDSIMVEALSKSEEEDDLKRALQIYETLEGDVKTNCLPHVIRTNIALNYFEAAQTLLPTLQSETLHKLFQAQILHRQGKFLEALQILKDETSLCDWFLEIGSLYWDLGEKDKSLVPFLKAAKIDPSNFRCFLLLGNFYRDVGDLDKARRCYEKAFKLNTRCSEAGIELSKAYRALKLWDANVTLLKSLTSGVVNKQNAWAWMQLGLSYMDQEDYDKAIMSLRFVIRVDGDNMHCWESLADGYLAKGAYTSALKCYERASELSGKAVYPLLQMASIKLVLGEYTEARTNFEEILSSRPYYVPALKGISETRLSQANQCHDSHRYGTARDHAQTAAENLIKAIQQRSDLACLWKLLGDSCVFASKLPEKYRCLLLPASFVEGKEAAGNKILEQEDLLVLATRCYSKALSSIEDNVLIWHDLASCYLLHCLTTEDEKLAVELMGRAEAAARLCCAKNPTSWQSWNLLANVAVNSNPPNHKLAQHALIKAVVADNNSAVSWCNLGTLYFIVGDFKLANEAFSQAQRADPNYVNSWVGQAMLAEAFDHEDAMDLFRHSTQLGTHAQGALGYGHWVCKTLKESPPDDVIYGIHNMHAIPVASDVLTWYTENEPLDSAAWNMLGILQERLGLADSALRSFRNGLNLSVGEFRDKARVNCGRVLVRLGRYEAAVEMFGKVEEATFNSGSGLALALFKDGHFKESYEAYESALHWLTEEQSHQSELLVALAAMAYMFEGADAAKTLLFQSIQLKEPSPWALYATLALALLHEDGQLAALVYRELQGVQDGGDYALLTSYYYLLQHESQKAVHEVSKIVHRHPDRAPLWLALSSLLVRVQRERPSSNSAEKCAQTAMALGQNNMDVTKVLCLVSLSSQIAGDPQGALISAQKAVHCYPDLGEGWAVLASSLLMSKKLELSIVKAVLKHLQALNCNDALRQWTQKSLSFFV